MLPLPLSATGSCQKLESVPLLLFFLLFSVPENCDTIQALGRVADTPTLYLSVFGLGVFDATSLFDFGVRVTRSEKVRPTKSPGFPFLKRKL